MAACSRRCKTIAAPDPRPPRLPSPSTRKCRRRRRLPPPPRGPRNHRKAATRASRSAPDDNIAASAAVLRRLRVVVRRPPGRARRGKRRRRRPQTWRRPCAHALRSAADTSSNSAPTRIAGAPPRMAGYWGRPRRRRPSSATQVGGGGRRRTAWRAEELVAVSPAAGSSASTMDAPFKVAKWIISWIAAAGSSAMDAVRRAAERPRRRWKARPTSRRAAGVRRWCRGGTAPPAAALGDPRASRKDHAAMRTARRAARRARYGERGRRSAVRVLSNGGMGSTSPCSVPSNQEREPAAAGSSYTRSAPLAPWRLVADWRV